MKLNEQQKENLAGVLDKYMSSHRLTHSFEADSLELDILDWEHYPLLDKLTPDGKSLELGKEEIRQLASDLVLEVEDFLDSIIPSFFSGIPNIEDLKSCINCTNWDDCNKNLEDYCIDWKWNGIREGDM